MSTRSAAKRPRGSKLTRRDFSPSIDIDDILAQPGPSANTRSAALRNPAISLFTDPGALPKRKRPANPPATSPLCLLPPEILLKICYALRNCAAPPVYNMDQAYVLLSLQASLLTPISRLARTCTHIFTVAYPALYRLCFDFTSQVMPWPLSLPSFLFMSAMSDMLYFAESIIGLVK